MINGKLFFDFAKENYEQWGDDSFLPMTAKLKDGLSIGIIQDNEDEYLIIGKDFIVKTDVEVVLDNPSAENGSWQKEYYAVECTKQYWTDSKNIGIQKCQDKILDVVFNGR